MAGRDSAECVYNFLKTHTNAATFRSMVWGGADNVLEAGDLTPTVLTKAETARRAAPADKVLAVSVQDSGEDPTSSRGVRAQYVLVRIYDRFMGYGNLRTARIELMRILKGFYDQFDSASKQGGLQMSYRGRTGYRWDRVYNVEYEALTYGARVVFKED